VGLSASAVLVNSTGSSTGNSTGSSGGDVPVLGDVTGRSRRASGTERV